MKEELLALEGIAGPLSVVLRGTNALAAWCERRAERNYADFIEAAKEGLVFAENADAMTPDDLFAILQSLQADIEAEKATLYGRLASSIAKGQVAKEHRRHFINALRGLSYAQVHRLRSAWVAANHELWSSRGLGRRSQDSFFLSGSTASMDTAAIQQYALLENGKLSPVGAAFVQACFDEAQLTPSAIGQKAWASGTIQVICNEMGDGECSAFISSFAHEGHRRAIRVRNTAARRGHSERFRVLSGDLVVLLYRDPQALLKTWDVVTGMTRATATFVAVAVGTDSTFLPVEFASYEFFAAGSDSGQAAMAAILELFEAQGFRGHDA